MKHPKRHLANGVVTTRMTRGVVLDPYCIIHGECYQVWVSWAGDTNPRPLEDMHAYVCNDGKSIGLLHAPSNETPQWKAGVRKRVANLRNMA